MNKLAILAEVFILILNLLIFMQLTILKKDNALSRSIMYIGTFLLLCAFVVCTLVFNMPEALTSFLCITIPSSTLFFIMSKYKDMRFFTTFCLLDTITLVLTFLSRAVEILVGKTAGVFAYILVCLLMLLAFIFGKPYFKQYRRLVENVKDGWGSMATSTFLIYVLLIFTASYPAPLRERPEYISSYALLSITLLSFYLVYILSLLQKKKLYDLNISLKQQQYWHEMAYVDSLTGLKNRMAYVEAINEIERRENRTDSMYAIMLDLDNFKSINDTFGHHVGDVTLKKAAGCLSNVFQGESYDVFRIGGDEFAVISNNVSKETLKQKLCKISNAESENVIDVTFSYGYSQVAPEQDNSMENAFIRADRAMYEMKSNKKKED